MKIGSYNQQVNNGGVANATIKRVSDQMAYGGDGKGLRAVSQGLGMMADVVIKKQEEDDKENILKAMDAYNKGRFEIMYNQDNGLMNTTLDASEGISNSYLEQEKKLRAEVLGGVKLYNQRNMVALNNLMDNSARQGYESVYRYQTKQKVAANEVRFSDYMNKQNEYAQNNYGNLDIVGSLMQQSDLMTDLQYRKIGGEALVQEKQKAAKGSIAASSITAAITHEDYATARKLKDAFGSFLTTEQRAAFDKVLYQKEAANFEHNLGQDLYRMFGDDEAAARNYLSNANGFVAEMSELDSMRKAIAGQESDGDYNAVNKDSGAFGRYQFMPESWKEWCAEFGLDANDKSPANQDRVFDLKMGQYIGKYGMRGAAIAWYAGEGSVGASAETLNAQQDNGKYPSINEYADSVMQRVANASQAKPMSLDEQNRSFQQYQMAKNEAERQQTYLNTQIFDNAKNTILQMRQQGIPARDAWKKVMEMSGANVNAFTQWEKAYSAIYGGGSGDGKGLGQGVNMLLEQLRENKDLQNKGDFLDYARMMGANDSDMEKLDKGFNDFLKGAGVFKYDIQGMANEVIGNSIRSDEGKARIAKGLNNVAYDFIRKFRTEHKGMDPDESLVKEEMQNALVKMPLGKYTTDYGRIWDSTASLNLSRAELASAGIDTIQKVDGANDMYEVTYRDGRIGGIVNGAYLAQITGVGK